MGEALGLVREQQDDVAGRGLLPEQPQAQAGALDRLPLLAVLQTVPRPPADKAPLWRMTTLSCEVEMLMPVR